ncbi:MAG: hypothetical protein Q4F43_05090 [Eubacteriales bacterium]|nr:hypothetical protein [Eubacteriales bacterium]
MNYRLVPSRGRLNTHRNRLLSKPGLSGKLHTVKPMFLYMILYLISFMLIEHWNRLHYTVIHTAVDDLIPFRPVFVIPYMLWFPFVTVSVLFLLMKNEDAYHRLCSTLMFGMTVFILVSVVFPNIHLMRPETMPDESVFSRMVTLVYTVDTPTNLTPSIHVYNSLAVVASMWNWDWRTDDGFSYSGPARAFWRTIVTSLGLLISVSTMLIKQHSFSDVVIAAGLFVFFYALVYRFNIVLTGSSARRERRRPALRPRSARS